MGGGPERGLKSDINITPLVDVVLVLLIIFMVVTPMLQRGKDVRLPEAKKTDEEQKQADPLVVSMTHDKKVWVESTPYDDDGLTKELSKQVAASPNRKILLKGDDRLTFGDVRRVMDLARRSGAKGIALGVQEKKGP